MVINASAELSVLQAVAQFLTYAVMAVFAENAVFFRALGVSRLNKLVNDPKISTWQYCIPIILVQTISAPMGWAAQSLALPALAKVLPGWLPVNALRPLVFLNCSLIAMGIVWLLLGLFPKSRDACREQLPGATFNCCVLGTLLVAASQNYNLLQSIGFGFGSGVGYLLAVLLVTEAQHRLRSKAIPSAFRGLPITLVYIGVLALAGGIILLVTSQKNGQGAPVAAGAAAGMGSGKAPARGGRGPVEKRAVLRGVTGKYSGQSFDLLKGKVVIGRDPATCNIVFDKNTPGISGRHCQVVYDPNEDCFIITDLGSSYGTFLGNGKKLTANVAEKLSTGDTFYLCDNANRFVVSKE